MKKFVFALIIGLISSSVLAAQVCIENRGGFVLRATLEELMQIHRGELVVINTQYTGDVLLGGYQCFETKSDYVRFSFDIVFGRPHTTCLQQQVRTPEFERKTLHIQAAGTTLDNRCSTYWY